MIEYRMIWSVVVFGALAAAGCSQNGNPAGSFRDAEAAAQGAKYLLAAEPLGARGVAEARTTTGNGDEVVVVGRVGGSPHPFVKDLAAFEIVDPSLKPCEDCCEAPWDYCCDLNALPASKAMVQIVDDQGGPLPIDARKLLGLQELSRVVVHGKAKRDEAGNFTVIAAGVYVEP